MADHALSKNTIKGSALYGLVVCGGKSLRMGTDKSMLVYHNKPQCYELYEMIAPFCENVFISCNDEQVNKITPGYSTITDLPVYSDSGPMAALLTAFGQYAGKDILVIGCDYPFLKSVDILDFLQAFPRTEPAAAFYNAEAALYEPLLAYYNNQSVNQLLKMFANNEYSLQHFLKRNNAFKFYPKNPGNIKSIDTKEDYIKSKELIRQRQ